LARRDDSGGHVQKELENRVVDFSVVRLELWLNVYDECGGYGRK